MNYIIRLMAKENLEECAEVIRQGFMTVANEFGLTPANCPTNGAFIQKERLIEEMEKGQKMYGLIAENRIVGFMQLEKTNEELYFLQKLVVLLEYRHFGLGGKLLDYARKLVKEWGGKKISIGIIEENTVLKNWYQSYGFVHTGVRKFEHLPFTVGFMEFDIEDEKKAGCDLIT